MLLAQVTNVDFTVSPFVPIAIGFFGLGTGYLIYGPQELFGFPDRDRRVDITTGIWGVWMPGFMQFLAGMFLFLGLTVFHTFREPALYMTAVAFTAFGVHWWAIGMGRAFGGDARPNAFMCIPFTVLSVIGAFIFFHVDDVPVALLFIGLGLVYISDFFASLAIPIGTLALGFFHLLTGSWLMYLTLAAVLNLAAGYSLWL
ncbi:MAG TPA: hypothetical protein VGM91_14665 [Conexibacter sp.]